MSSTYRLGLMEVLGAIILALTLALFVKNKRLSALSKKYFAGPFLTAGAVGSILVILMMITINTVLE